MNSSQTITTEQIKRSEKARDKAIAEHEKLREQLAIQECPFTVGQIIDNGYGRAEGSSVKVTRIRAPRGAGGTWLLCGCIVDEDGKVTHDTIEFDSLDYLRVRY